MSKMQLLKEIKNAKSIGICGHIRPDGDCIGSSMAAYLYLKKVLPEADIHVFLEDIPTIYHLIAMSSQIESAEDREDQFDLFIVLDCAVDRTGPAEVMVRKAKRVINIDHHKSNITGSGDVNIVDPNASSASEVLFECLDENMIDKDIAEALYIGVINDSGVFQYSCTSPRTLEIAAKLIGFGFPFPEIIEKTFYEKTYVQNQLLGRALLESILIMDGKCIVSSIDRKTMEFYNAKPKHLDGIVSQLRNTRGVECAIFMYEINSQEYKVSLRSAESIDVSVIAEQFGGGGHMRAAGCTMNGNFYDNVNNLSALIEKQLKTK